jgi:hypothetical protein
MGSVDFIGAAVSGLQQRTETRPRNQLGQNDVSRFPVESLKPRILLSAYLVSHAAAAALPQGQPNLVRVTIVEQLLSHSIISASFDSKSTIGQAINNSLQPSWNKAMMTEGEVGL